MTDRCRDVPWRVSTIQNINPYFIDIQYIIPHPRNKIKSLIPPKIRPESYVYIIKNPPKM